jgi:hypothetical protein
MPDPGSCNLCSSPRSWQSSFSRAASGRVISLVVLGRSTCASTVPRNRRADGFLRHRPGRLFILQALRDFRGTQSLLDKLEQIRISLGNLRIPLPLPSLVDTAGRAEPRPAPDRSQERFPAGSTYRLLVLMRALQALARAILSAGLTRQHREVLLATPTLPPQASLSPRLSTARTRAVLPITICKHRRVNTALLSAHLTRYLMNENIGSPITGTRAVFPPSLQCSRCRSKDSPTTRTGLRRASSTSGTRTLSRTVLTSSLLDKAHRNREGLPTNLAAPLNCRSPFGMEACQRAEPLRSIASSGKGSTTHLADLPGAWLPLRQSIAAPRAVLHPQARSTSLRLKAAAALLTRRSWRHLVLAMGRITAGGRAVLACPPAMRKHRRLQFKGLMAPGAFQRYPSTTKQAIARPAPCARELYWLPTINACRGGPRHTTHSIMIAKKRVISLVVLKIYCSNSLQSLCLSLEVPAAPSALEANKKRPGIRFQRPPGQKGRSGMIGPVHPHGTLPGYRQTAANTTLCITPRLSGSSASRVAS